MKKTDKRELMNHTHMTEIHIGLEADARAAVVEVLNTSLANAYVLLVKTKKAHWDVVGPQFRPLHLMLDEHYELLSTYSDELAERARMLGGHSIATMVEFLDAAQLEEMPGVLSDAGMLVDILVSDHEKLCTALRLAVDLADDAGDVGTADLLTQQLQGHEKMAWMLRSFREGEIAGALRSPSAVAKGNHALQA